MIRVPSTLSAAAASAQADVRRVVTLSTDLTTIKALERGDAFARQAMETLKQWRFEAAATLATERKRARDEAAARERMERRNAEIIEERARA